ncbi:MAG: hypothetical protein V4492_08220 [Chlamydiota bacterium]
MRSLVFFLPCIVLGLISCSPKEDEEIDYDQMVMLEEEEEWTSSRPEKMLAGDVSPEPQEVVVTEGSEIR